MPNLDDIAEQLLNEVSYLKRCAEHDTLLAVGDESDIKEAYKLASSRIRSGEIVLAAGQSQRNLTDCIKETADSAFSECESCKREGTSD